MTVAPLARTLDRELQALLRGASLECLVCGEFVQHLVECIRCPECGADYGRAAGAQLELGVQAG